jgi:hypothetical protein
MASGQHLASILIGRMIPLTSMCSGGVDYWRRRNSGIMRLMMAGSQSAGARR